jgi:hypothetical protein
LEGLDFSVAEDPSLFGGELLIGENTLGVKVAELLQVVWRLGDG